MGQRDAGHVAPRIAAWRLGCVVDCATSGLGVVYTDLEIAGSKRPRKVSLQETVQHYTTASIV